MALNADPKLSARFQKERKKHTTRKLDMGKGCIRFKYYEEIPYKLIGDLAGKMTPQKWIDLYEKAYGK